MSEQVASQNQVVDPVYPDDPTTVHKVKDMLSATLDLVEPSNIRFLFESEEHIAERIIEAYGNVFKFPTFVCCSRDEYAEALCDLHKKYGPIKYEDFKERPPIID
jgi:hypothetical protein